MISKSSSLDWPIDESDTSSRRTAENRNSVANKSSIRGVFISKNLNAMAENISRKEISYRCIATAGKDGAVNLREVRRNYRPERARVKLRYIWPREVKRKGRGFGEKIREAGIPCFSRRKSRRGKKEARYEALRSMRWLLARATTEPDASHTGLTEEKASLSAKPRNNREFGRVSKNFTKKLGTDRSVPKRDTVLG